VTKFKEENALLTQAFVKDPSRKVGDLINDAVGKLGENIQVGRFVRYQI
jgi:elongation factor Ts